MLARRKGARIQVELQDLLALVVGYAMAALLFRAFWRDRPPWSAFGLPGAALYLWLGLAMSGPIIMLRRRLSRPAPAPGDLAADRAPGPGAPRLWAPAASGLGSPPAGASGTTWAERAWLLIGAYWIVLGIFVIPARLHEFKLGDVLLFGLAPIIVAIGLRLLGPTVSQGPDVVRGWTHAAAIALLATWPFAWFCLFVLGKSMR
jgi:hypothetical protein